MALSDEQFERAIKRMMASANEAADRLQTFGEINDKMNRVLERDNAFKKWEEALKRSGRLQTEQGEKALEAIKRTISAQNNATQIQKAAAEEFGKITGELRKTKANIRNLLTQGVKNTDDALMTLMTLREREAELAKQAQQQKTSYKSATDAIDGHREGLTQLTNIVQSSTKPWSERIRENTLSFIGSKASVVAFAAGLHQLAAQISEVVASNRGFFEGGGFVGIFNQYKQALLEGVTPQHLGEIMSANRQAVLAVGGQAKALELMKHETETGASVLSEYRRITGDNTVAMRTATEQLTIMGKAGIRPTAQGLKAFAEEVTSITKLTGMAPAEISGHLASIFNQDVEMQHILRSVRENERQAIVTNTTAMLKQNLALGMTTEQATEAAKMLSKMVAQKPLDRIKQAARIRALAGAMGIAGGEEAAQALMRGGRTPEDRAALQRFSQAASTQADTMRGMGLTHEIFATQLLEKLDLEAYLGKGSPFSESMVKALEPQKAAVDNLNITNATLSSILKLIEGVSTALLQTLVPVTIALGAGVGVIAALLLKRGMGIPSLTKGIGPLGEEALETGAKAAKKAGGKSLLKKVPGVGLVAGGAFAGRRASAGDWRGAALELGSGAASLIPGVGTAASLSFDAMLLSRDLKQIQDVSTGEIVNAETESQTIFKSQLDRIEQSNSLLSKIAELTEQQLEMGAKQLTAMTLSDGERKELMNLNAQERLQRLRATSTQYRTFGSL